MEQKNKFDTFDKPDDFDKMLFDYYDNNNEEVPLSTQNAIENAFKDKHKEKSTTIILLKRRLANCIEFGYEKERYPIQIFFQGTKYFEEAINYSKTIPRTFEERLEYGCELSNIEFNKIKELKL